MWKIVGALKASVLYIYIDNNVSVATGNTNNAGRIKIFGVYFQNGDDHDLNKSVSIENQSSKNIENEIDIDAERK